MKSGVQALFDAGVLPKTSFPPESRYHGIEMAVKELPDGRTVAYLKRRAVPDPDRFATLGEHRVRQGERLDQIAAAAVGDPEQYWKLCDANGVLRPEDLEVVDQAIRLTLPEGVQASEADED